jgi:hypothetical protein
MNGCCDDDEDDDGIPADRLVFENPRAEDASLPAAASATGLHRKEVQLTKEGKPRKRDPVDPSRCIYCCDNCDKAFTTKFNLKRHINLHCNKSKEAGVPIQVSVLFTSISDTKLSR